MKITIPSYDAYKYVEVREITEKRDGCVFKTKRKGFALSTRPKQKDEIYASLSTSLTSQRSITLELLDDHPNF